jgi:DNA replication protein DnaC
VLQSLELRLRQAGDDSLAYEEFLLRLLADEVDRRGAKQLEQRLRRASFEHHRTLEDFDFQFNPQLPKSKILELGTCTFVERNEPVLIVGPTGTGKSHLAQALGHRACRAGFTALYIAANELLRQLRTARADNTYDRKLLRFTAVELLIIDDLGLRPLVGEEAMDLYEIIRLRYERASTVVTSNRAVGELGTLFGDPLLASAAMDRLLHNAHVIVLEGDSYRNPPPERRKARATSKGAAREVTA